MSSYGKNRFVVWPEGWRWINVCFGGNGYCVFGVYVVDEFVRIVIYSYETNMYIEESERKW